MIKCPLLYERNWEIGKNKEKKQIKREKKPNKEVIRELVPKRFWR